MDTQLNNFSLISRLFGNLFLRSPTDPILTNVFAWLQAQGLDPVWPLSKDKESEGALANLAVKLDLKLLDVEYEKLFGKNGKVNTAISHYGFDLIEFAEFRLQRAMPIAENLDHFSLLLLTASWLEDNTNSVAAQQELFEQFLLPCAAKFLPLVEQHASLPFYRSLAYLTREILAAMADELEENSAE